MSTLNCSDAHRDERRPGAENFISSGTYL